MSARLYGISTKKPGLTRENFALYRESGISAVEISVDQSDFESLDLERAVADARAEGILPWSFHTKFMPFEEIDVSSPDREIRLRTVRFESEWIARAGACGCKVAVLHPSGEPNPDAEREERMKCACDSLSVLGEVASRAGIILAVENLPRTCLARGSEELLRLVASHPALRVCFDTNHLLTGETQADFIRAVGEKLVTVHLSDYDFLNERHWLPGEGKIDWVALVDALDAVGYAGPMMFELPAVSPTMIRPRPLVPADYRRCADELLSRSPLSLRGVPVDGLKHW